MISVITILILAVTGKLANMDPVNAICFGFMGICLEALLIWLPFIDKSKWLGKKSYFKFLYESLF